MKFSPYLNRRVFVVILKPYTRIHYFHTVSQFGFDKRKRSFTGLAFLLPFLDILSRYSAIELSFLTSCLFPSHKGEQTLVS